MNWIDERLLLTLTNLILCGGIGFVCLCRAKVMSADTTRKQTRAVYAILGAAAAANGGWFWIAGEYAGVDNVIMSAALLLHMLAGAKAWRHGIPDFAKSDRAPLEHLR